MGLPKIQFTPEAIWSFVANHGEKILVLIVVLCSLPLALGGINALRLKTRSSKEEPKEIARLADNANSLLSRSLPTDQQTELNKSLASASVERDVTLEAWSPTEISRLSVDAGFNRPLLGDIQRRQVPVVFPLEQLVAIAGVVAIANQDDLLMGGDPSLGGAFSEMEMMMEDPMGMQPTVMSPPAKKMPYVILTGLIPFRKQLDEYIALYSRASYQSPERDFPIWHDYAVERLEVRPDGGGEWKVIDITRLYEDWKDNWASTSTDSIPQQFLLPSAQNLFDPAEVPIGYWSPLPTLAAKPTLNGVDDGMMGGDPGMGGPGSGSSWGLQTIHPWAKEEMKKLLDEQKKLALEQQDGMGLGGEMGYGMEFGGEFGGGMTGTSTGTFSPFGDTEMGMEEGMYEEYDESMMGYGPDGEGMMFDQDYCLFRFIDTSVEPGRLYRYRVTLRAWNPNWNLPKKFLESPELADDQFVQSATSDPFPSLDAMPVHVPADNLLIARLLLRDEKKTYGLGVSDQELLVLDSNEDSGNFELHSIESKPGDIVGSRKGARKIKQFNNRRISVPPHNVDTDQTLLAVVGQQTIDGKKRPGRGFIPPEPLEILITDSAGTLDVIAADACEETVREYLPTLPGFQPPQAVDPYMMEEMEMMGF
mgnify:FL=1